MVMLFFTGIDNVLLLLVKNNFHAPLIKKITEYTEQKKCDIHISLATKFEFTSKFRNITFAGAL